MLGRSVVNWLLDCVSCVSSLLALVFLLLLMLALPVMATLVVVGACCQEEVFLSLL